MRYFLARYNRYYAFIMQQDIRLLYGALFCMQLSMLLIWFYVWYMPIHKIIIQQKQIVLNTDTLLLYTSLKKRTNDIKTYISYLERQYYDAQWNKNQLQRIMPKCIDIAKKSGIGIERCVVNQSKKNEICEVYNVHIDCKATISQLAFFFNLLLAEKIPVRCMRLDGNYDEHCSTKIDLQWYCLIDKKSPSTLEKS